MAYMIFQFFISRTKMSITNELSITCIFKYIWFTVKITHFFTNCFNYDLQVFLWSAIRLFHVVMCCGYKKPLWRPSFFYERRCFQKTMSHALGSKVIAQLKMFTILNVNPIIMYMIAINSQHEQSRIMLLSFLHRSKKYQYIDQYFPLSCSTCK